MTETDSPIPETIHVPVWLPPDSKWRLGPPQATTRVVQPSSAPQRPRPAPPARESAVPTERVLVAARKPEEEIVAESRGAADARLAPADEGEQCASAAEEAPDSLRVPDARVECAAPRPRDEKAPLALVVSCKALGKCLSLVSNDDERVEFLLALSQQARVEPCAEADRHGARDVFPCAHS